MADRIASITRATSETDIDLSLNLDGAGKVSVSTGFGLADHMLDLTAFWAGFDLSLTCRGDSHIDAHHSLEDSALVLDLSGRPYLVYQGAELLPPVMAGEERDLWREFFKSLAAGARMNLHITYHYGLNGHHLLESACKGLGLALRQAVSTTRDHLLSTKGSLD